MNNYIENRNKRIERIAIKIDNNQINIYNLDDDLIDELISYYSKQICIKKQQISNIRKKVKGGN